jgi:hypothetical protein
MRGPTASGATVLGIVQFVPEPAELLRSVGLSAALTPDERHPASRRGRAHPLPLPRRPFTETFVLAYDGTPERFVAAAAEQAPHTVTRVLEPGERLSLVSSP